MTENMYTTLFHSKSLYTLSIANIRNKKSIIPFSGILFQLKKELYPIRRTMIFSLHHFALICSEMGTFAVSKRAKYKWEVL